VKTMKQYTVLPGEIAVLICLEAEYMCLTKGIRLINCSPSQKTVEPNHDEANIPTKKVKSTDVMNPSPNMSTPRFSYIGLKKPSTNWINHQVMRNVTATGKSTTLPHNTQLDPNDTKISNHEYENKKGATSYLQSSHKLLRHPTL